eukprot:gene21059-27939_t
MVALVQQRLQLMYEEAKSAGILPPTASRRVVVAAIVQKRGRPSEEGGSRLVETLLVVALATGNKSLHPGHKSDARAGQHIVDSHAEVLARRAFVLYLAGMLAENRQQGTKSIFEGSRIRTGVSFHLYVSTAPCGDARRFLQTHCAGNKHARDVGNSLGHNLDFSNPKLGKLVTKIEDGMTGSPIDSQRIDANRRHSMSCSDKVLKWATYGLQGGLLASKLEEPVKLSSVIIGSNFERGHVERALCCRSAQGCLGLQLLHVPLPGTSSPHKRNNRLSNTSLNWFAGAAETEANHGSAGKQHGGLPSRLCKASMARSISASALLGKPLELEAYVQWKRRLLLTSSAGRDGPQHAATSIHSTSWLHLCQRFQRGGQLPTGGTASNGGDSFQRGGQLPTGGTASNGGDSQMWSM